MSQFDELFDASCSSPLIDHFGDERSVSVKLGSKWLVRGATGIIRSQRTIEEDGDDRIVKRLEMEVDMLVDEHQLPDKGLTEITTAAKAVINKVDWNITDIENRTATFVTLKVTRKMPREFSTSGFRRQQT